MHVIFLLFASALLIEAQDFNTYNPAYVAINHEINKYSDEFNDVEDNFNMDDILAPYSIFGDEEEDGSDWIPTDIDAISDAMTSQVAYHLTADDQADVAAPYGIFDNIIKTTICSKVGPQICKLMDPLFPCIHMGLAMKLKQAASQGKLALLNFTLSTEMYEALSPCLNNCTRDAYKLALDAKSKGMVALLNVSLSPEMYEAVSPCLGNCTRDVYRLAVDAKGKQKYAITGEMPN